ncbi:metal ABC transporter solute-binding protein, Zn/Mn family [Pacificoceanicola onchidii]|uniref:metal ABC transporter solute-binding protein, Zn/Mn family n=1 Tax=Pacificoceanicola onchidii TaxID=2562685 RepID=UPI0010A661F5|nr:zinc ABC transporter substrate-binding protein [Pacificoceanicola onchidii]
MTSRRTLLKSATALVAASFIAPGVALADDKLPVVATFSVLGDMVSRIGGEHVALTTLVGRGGDTHVYNPTPQDAAAVAAADVLFMNGLEFEGWLERLAEAAPFEGETVIATAGIDAIAYDEAHDDHDEHDDHGHDEHEEHAHDDHEDHEEHEHEEHAGHDDHDDHHGHDHGAFDPHTWQTVENAVIYADNIAAGLAKADPENAGDYYANRAAFVAELEALGVEIDALMATIPEDKRTVVTPHDAFGYLGARYDLTFVAPQGMSTESEATAADVAALITQIREYDISAVFIETITDNRLVEMIASETGATVGGTLYSGALSEEGGPAATYLDMLRHNAETIAAALGQ